jgi:hypothetical protein
LADISKLLRKQQRKSQVPKQQHRHDQRNRSNDVDVHRLPQLLARLDVKKRQDKENEREQQHGQILHRELTQLLESGAISRSTRLIHLGSL